MHTEDIENVTYRKRRLYEVRNENMFSIFMFSFFFFVRYGQVYNTVWLGYDVYLENFILAAWNALLAARIRRY